MDSRTIAALFLLVVALALGGLAMSAAASHGDDNTNFTVTPENRDPGASEVTYTLEMKWTDTATGNAAMEDIDNATFVIQNTNIENCAEGGLVGGPPYTLLLDDGSETQELSVQSSQWDGNAVEFVLEEDSPRFRVGYTLILELDGCVVNGDDEGWFQAFGVVEGPAVTEGQSVALDGSSHYFGICEGCESDDDAREELGSPPSEQESTPTPMATATPEPDDTPTATETESAAPGPTETSEPVSTPGDMPTPTDADTPGATDTPTETDDDEVAGDESSGASAAPGDVQVFGMDPLAVVGVVALLSIALAGIGARKL